MIFIIIVSPRFYFQAFLFRYKSVNVYLKTFDNTIIGYYILLCDSKKDRTKAEGSS